MDGMEERNGPYGGGWLGGCSRGEKSLNAAKKFHPARAAEEGRNQATIHLQRSLPPSVSALFFCLISLLFLHGK